ncbi:hypothetical protein JCM8097_003933 [Rhodosporidiobolus ruineniae]
MRTFTALGLTALLTTSAFAQSCPSGSQKYSYEFLKINGETDETTRTQETSCCTGVLHSDNMQCTLQRADVVGKYPQSNWFIDCVTTGAGMAWWSVDDGITSGNSVFDFYTAGANPRKFWWGNLAMQRRPKAYKYALFVDAQNPDGSLYSGAGDYSCIANSPNGVCSQAALQVSTTYTTSTNNAPNDFYVYQVNGGQLLGQSAPVGRAHINAILSNMKCFDPRATTTVYDSSQTVSQTNYVETQYTPSATLTEMPTSTVTVTPDVSTVTDIHTEEVDLRVAFLLPAFPADLTPLSLLCGPDYYPVYVNGGTTTAPTETVQASTTVTEAPEAATITSTSTPDVSTIYETSWATSTPPTKTITSVQTVATGNANCIDYRLVYPAECCPNKYVKLIPVKHQRRAIPFGKRDEPSWNTVTVQGGVTTSTVIVQATQTLPSGQATVTEPVTQTETAATPLETVFTTTTETLPQPQVPYTVTEYDETLTPYETVVQTISETAPTPTEVVSETAATPLSTVTVTSTRTLEQPVTTTTSTKYVQATTCAVKTVHTQSSCAGSNLVGGLVQNAQVATLNLYKALGGKNVIVDCGSVGTFAY